MTKFSLLIWHYVVSGKWMVKISSIFVAFLENTNIMTKNIFIADIKEFILLARTIDNWIFSLLYLSKDFCALTQITQITLPFFSSCLIWKSNISNVYIWSCTMGWIHFWRRTILFLSSVFISNIFKIHTLKNECLPLVAGV